MTRPAHRDPALLLIVAVGGGVGTTARYLLTAALPPVDGFPIATFVANLVGALALGALLEGLSRRGPETTRAKRARLGLGTGVLGGFTTFSSLALETERLLAAGRVGLGVGYAVGSVVLGLVACVAGIGLASGRRRGEPDGEDGTRGKGTGRTEIREVPRVAAKYPLWPRRTRPAGVPRGHTGYLATEPGNATEPRDATEPGSAGRSP